MKLKEVRIFLVPNYPHNLSEYDYPHLWPSDHPKVQTLHYRSNPNRERIITGSD